MKRTIALLTILAATSLLIALSTQAQDESLDAQKILDRVNSAWQGDSFHAVMTLDLILGGQTKSHVLEVWTLGEKYALIRVLKPVEDEGSGYLQIGDDLWYYSPVIGEAIKLPAIALADALFGSGPSLEDLSQGTLSDHYSATVTVLKEDAGYLLVLIPHPDAPAGV